MTFHLFFYSHRLFGVNQQALYTLEQIPALIVPFTRFYRTRLDFTVYQNKRLPGATRSALPQCAQKSHLDREQ
jgi:hypothetical protein